MNVVRQIVLQFGAVGNDDFVGAVLDKGLTLVLDVVAEEDGDNLFAQDLSEFVGLAEQFEADGLDDAVALLNEYEYIFVT